MDPRLKAYAPAPTAQDTGAPPSNVPAAAPAAPAPTSQPGGSALAQHFQQKKQQAAPVAPAAPAFDPTTATPEQAQNEILSGVAPPIGIPGQATAQFAMQLGGAMVADKLLTEKAAVALTGLLAQGVQLNPYARAAILLGTSGAVQTIGESMVLIAGKLIGDDESDLTTSEGWSKLSNEMLTSLKWNMGAAGVIGTVGLSAIKTLDGLRTWAHGQFEASRAGRAETFAQRVGSNMFDPAIHDRAGVPLDPDSLAFSQRSAANTSQMPLPRSAYFSGKMTAFMENLFGGAPSGYPLRQAAEERMTAATDYFGNFYRRISTLADPTMSREMLITMLHGTNEAIDGATEGLVKSVHLQALKEGADIVPLHKAREQARARVASHRNATGETGSAPLFDRNLAEGRIGGGANNPKIVNHVDTNVMPTIRANLLAKHGITEADLTVAANYKPSTGGAKILDATGAPANDGMSKLLRKAKRFNAELEKARSYELGSYTDITTMMRTIKHANATAKGAFKATLTPEGAGVIGRDVKLSADHMTKIMDDHLMTSNAIGTRASWHAYRDLTRASKAGFVERNRIARTLINAEAKGPGEGSAKLGEALYNLDDDGKRAIMYALEHSPLDFLQRFRGAPGAKGPLAGKERSRINKALDKLHHRTQAKLGTKTGLENAAMREARLKTLEAVRASYIDSIADRIITANTQGINSVSLSQLSGALSSQKHSGFAAVLGKDRATEVHDFLRYLQEMTATPLGDVSKEVMSFRLASKIEEAGRAAINTPGRMVGNATALTAGAGAIGAAQALGGPVAAAGMAITIGSAYVYLPYKIGKLLTSRPRMEKLMQIMNTIHNPQTRDIAGSGWRTLTKTRRPMLTDMSPADAQTLLGPVAHNVKQLITELQTMDDDGNTPEQVRSKKPAQAAQPGGGIIPMGAK